MSNEYLTKRLLQYQGSLFSSVDKKTLALIKRYEVIHKELTTELASLYAKHGVDGALPLTELHKYGRLKTLDAQLVNVGRSLGAAEAAFLSSELPELYQASRIAVGQVLGVEFTRLPAARINKLMEYPWSGANFSDRIWDNKRLLVKGLREEIIRGSVRGSSFRTVTERLGHRLQGSAAATRRLVRTESMFFINRSQLDTFQEQGVERLEFIAAYDDRTCEDCGDLDGQIFELGREEQLPLHPNCRCTYAPVTDSTWKGGTNNASIQAAIDGGDDEPPE